MLGLCVGVDSRRPHRCRSRLSVAYPYNEWKGRRRAMKTVGANVSRTTGALALLGGLGGGEADPRQVWNPEYVRVGGELTRQMRRGADARCSFQVEVDWAQPYRAHSRWDRLVTVSPCVPAPTYGNAWLTDYAFHRG